MNYFSKNKGFTLVELMVVMTIATIMMTTLVVQQNQWNDSLTVNTQAYELALMIRQAQIYSLGVREDTAGSGDKFNIGYGVYFSQNNLNQYIYFADRNGNKKYDSNLDPLLDEKIGNPIIFNRGVTIDRICGVKDVGQHEDKCAPDSGNISSLSITFFRPDPKANVLLLNNGGNQSGDVIPPAKIYLKSSGGKQYLVSVESNGQVSITSI